MSLLWKVPLTVFMFCTFPVWVIIFGLVMLFIFIYETITKIHDGY